MENLLLSGTAFLITFLIFPVFIKFFNERNFLDRPGGRKIHNEGTPSMGGLPIFLGFGLATLIWMPLGVLRDMKYVLSALGIMFIVGFRDDFVNLRSTQKLLGQLAAAFIIVVICGIRFTSLYGLFGVYDIPDYLSYAVSLLTVIVITNAFNLVDGIDGLAGSLGVLSSTFFGVWFYLAGFEDYSMICFAVLGTLLAFLHFNWAPSQMFMGDTGSLSIGFFLSIATIKFISTNYGLEDGVYYKFSASIAPAVAVLILPLCDTLRVFIKRILKGRSPMHPDRTHIHHILLRLGCNHAQATSILATASLVFILLALVLKDFSDAVVLPVLLVMALVLGTITEIIFKSRIKRRKEELKKNNIAHREQGKMVSMSKPTG